MTGKELKAARKRLGMTQVELGKALGLSSPFIGRMERGSDPIDVRTDMAVRHLEDRSTTLRFASNEWGSMSVPMNTKAIKTLRRHAKEAGVKAVPRKAAIEAALIHLGWDLRY